MNFGGTRIRKIEILVKKFGGFKKSAYLCNAKAETHIEILAKIAQLVEHDLAKVGVAGSSPVFRSARIRRLRRPCSICPDGGIGRRATLRG